MTNIISAGPMAMGCAFLFSNMILVEQNTSVPISQNPLISYSHEYSRMSSTYGTYSDILGAYKQKNVALEIEIQSFFSNLNLHQTNLEPYSQRILNDNYWALLDW